MGQSPLPGDLAGLAGAVSCLGLELGAPAERSVAGTLAGGRGILYCSFTEWYLSRYWLHSLPRLSLWEMILLNLAAAVLILGWGWIQTGLRRVAKK